MKKLISFEFRKAMRQKSLYICFAIVLGLICLSAIVNASLAKNPDVANNPEIAFSFTVESFTKSALSSSSFFLILGVFVALYCCDDVTNNTLKNLYSRGYTRGQVFFSKYTVSLIISIVMAAVSFLLAFIMGNMSANSGQTANLFTSIVCQFVIVIAYHAVFFSLATIIGKVGGSVAVNIVGPMLVLTVLSLVTSILKLDNLHLDAYWLDSAVTELSAATLPTKTIIKSIIMGIVYTAIFVPVGFVLNKKKEL